MDTPSGLPPAEKPGQPVECDADLRRHREAGQHHDRRENEKYRRIRELLQRIVFALLRRSLAEVQIVERHRQEPGQVARPQDELRYVAVRAIIDKIKNTVPHEKHSEEEMPAPAAGEPVKTGNRDPARKSA